MWFRYFFITKWKQILSQLNNERLEKICSTELINVRSVNVARIPNDIMTLGQYIQIRFEWDFLNWRKFNVIVCEKYLNSGQ